METKEKSSERVSQRKRESERERARDERERERERWRMKPMHVCISIYMLRIENGELE